MHPFDTRTSLPGTQGLLSAAIVFGNVSLNIFNEAYCHLKQFTQIIHAISKFMNFSSNDSSAPIPRYVTGISKTSIQFIFKQYHLFILSIFQFTYTGNVFHVHILIIFSPIKSD